MAIKVKHEGSAASRVAASAAGGNAKRAMEAAAFAKGRDIQQKQAAQAHAPSPGGAHAQLISAPGGAAHAQLISAPGGAAHAQLVGGGGGIGASARLGGARPSASGRAASSGAGGAYGQMKVTAHGAFNDPKDGSTYDRATDSWMRRYLPGEWEAEAAERMNPVLAEREENRYSARQKADWDNLETAYQDAVASGRYTQDELRELRRQTDYQKMQIKGNPLQSLEHAKTAQEDIDSRLVTIDGVKYYRTAKGDLELPPTGKTDDGGFGDFMKMYPKLSEYTEEVEEEDPITHKKTLVPITRQRSPEEVAQIYRKLKAAWEQGQEQPGGASPAAGGGADPVVAARQTAAPPITDASEIFGKWRTLVPGMNPTNRQMPAPAQAAPQQPVATPPPATPAPTTAPATNAPPQQVDLKKKWAKNVWK